MRRDRFRISVCLVMVLLFILSAAWAGAGSIPGGELSIACPLESLPAGEEAVFSFSGIPEGIDTLTVNVSLLFENGTAELLAISVPVAVSGGSASYTVTPPYRGILRVEAYYGTGRDEVSRSLMLPVEGNEVAFPMAQLDGPEQVYVQETARWTATVGESAAPYILRFFVTYIPEGGSPQTLPAQVYRSDGEKVFFEASFSEPGLVECQLEALDAVGLKCYLERTMTVVSRPFYSSVEKTALREGESLRMSVWKDDDTYQFASSDDSILSVGSHGEIVAHRPGEVTLTVTDGQEDGYSEQITFVVQPKGESISCEDMILAPGQRGVLHPTVVPATAAVGEWVFTSANPQIASVEADGSVQAVSPGETMILIISRDDPALNRAVKITVSGEEARRMHAFADEPALEEENGHHFISLRYGSQQGAEGERNYTITLIRDGERESVRQRSGDGRVRFSIAPDGAGNYILEVTARGQDGEQTTSSARVSITEDPSGNLTLQVLEETRPETYCEELLLDAPGTLYVGIPGKASVRILPEGYEAELLWTSSAPDCIRVDQEGGLEALKDGFAVITVTALDGSGVSASASVRAVAEELSLAEPLTALHRGQSATLQPQSATGTGYSYSFASSDPEVLSVDRGIVTALNEGNATVSVTAEEIGLELKVPVTVLPCLHERGEWIRMSDPDCVRDGEEQFLCDVCGEYAFSRAVPALGHNRGRWVTQVPASLTAAGVRVLQCTVCGEIVESAPIRPLQETTMNGNTACAEGVYVKNYLSGFDRWYMVTPVDLTRDGQTILQLIASNMAVIGNVYVKVEDGCVTVSYTLNNEDVCVTDEYFTFLRDLTPFWNLSFGNQRNYTYDVPYSIAEDLGGAERLLLFVCNRVNYNGCSVDYPLFTPEGDSYRMMLDWFTPMMKYFW